MAVREISMAEALNEALREEMRRDPTVIVMGEDVGVMGGVFKVTKGLLEEFGPERVIDTPICEEGFTGVGIGAALGGLRPVVEIMFADFLACCANQLINICSKLRYLTGGQVKVPIVIRTAVGWHYVSGHGGEHAQTLIPQFMNIPGLKIVAPSTPYDAKGLLKSAIRDDAPVIFYEPLWLYFTKGPVPEEEYTVPLGVADVKREGDDVTIVAISPLTLEALKAADELAKRGISAEVIDPRTLVPLDKETIIKSVKKTSRLVTVESCHKRCGVGSEIVSVVVEEAFDYLDAPPVRVAAANIPIATMQCVLAHHVVPTSKDVVEAAEKLVKGG